MNPEFAYDPLHYAIISILEDQIEKKALKTVFRAVPLWRKLPYRLPYTRKSSHGLSLFLPVSGPVLKRYGHRSLRMGDPPQGCCRVCSFFPCRYCQGVYPDPVFPCNIPRIPRLSGYTGPARQTLREFRRNQNPITEDPCAGAFQRPQRSVPSAGLRH